MCIRSSQPVAPFALALLLPLSALVACDCGSGGGPDGGETDAAGHGSHDAGAHDAGPNDDAGPANDDAGEPNDDAGGEGGDMVLVPAGAFLMGCDDCDADEAPQHSVTLSAFEIDVTEVTQAHYAACIGGGGCTAPSGNFDPDAFGAYPVVSVSWQQASEYCQFVGKRLPSEAEWEKAARGSDGRTFPWGEEASDCTRAITDLCGGDAFPVGSAALGQSPYGAMDMAGNVWEWTADWYAADAYAAHDDDDPAGPATGTNRVYRGGSAGNLANLARASNRADTYNPAVGGSGLGFRCAR